MGFCAGGELRGGVNPRRDRLKLNNCATRAMQDVMKLVRVASDRHLRNWEAPTPSCKKSPPPASRTDSGRRCAVATPKIPVNVQRFSIPLYRYRPKGLEPFTSGSTLGKRSCPPRNIGMHVFFDIHLFDIATPGARFHENDKP